jgi:sarcosine oxidase subunit gamma
MPERSAPAAVLAPLIDGMVPGFAERDGDGHLNLRGDPADARFVAAVRSLTGIDPPRAPNTTARAAGLQLAWLGPDEWLLSTPPGAAQPLHAALNEAFAGLHAAATDLSDAYAVLVLDCTDAAEILSCDCPLDFHARSFAIGACAQSLVGKCTVLIVREGEQRFAVYLRRSFAAYAYALLRHAAVMVRAAREIPRVAGGGGR